MTKPHVGTYYGSEKGNGDNWPHASAESRASSDRLATVLKFKGSDQVRCGRW
jgi:hypothetical protein